MAATTDPAHDGEFADAAGPHSELIAQLERGMVDVLAWLRPPGQFALVDFPAQANVGDAAIWLGTLRLMRRVYGADPAYVSKLDDFDPDACAAAVGHGTIFISGGGNFGDVAPAHQDFRRRLLAACPQHPIVQLPQSIGFRDSAMLAATAQAIALHGNFTLLVRDRASLAVARRFRCRSQLVCDFAFGLGVQARSVAPRADMVCVLRSGGDYRRAEETASDAEAHWGGGEWLRERRSRVRGRRLLAMLAAAASGAVDRRRLHAASFEAAARARVERGLRLLSSGRVVVTDRLHAHILCVLLGLPHAVLDTGDGTVGAFMQTWTADWPGVSMQSTLASALGWARARAGEIAHAA